MFQVGNEKENEFLISELDECERTVSHSSGFRAGVIKL
jgi:hypothetical protein